MKFKMKKFFKNVLMSLFLSLLLLLMVAPFYAIMFLACHLLDNWVSSNQVFEHQVFVYWLLRSEDQDQDKFVLYFDL